MDGVHDLGGMHGFGPVEREPDEPVFHAPWEAAVLAMMRAAWSRGCFNLDEFRHGIERMAPAHYLRASYYEKWLDGISRLLIEKGVVSASELAARVAFFEARPDAPAMAAVAGPLPARVPFDPAWREESWRETGARPRYAPGDRVVTRAFHPHGHTRLPRYARGKRGMIERCYGVHVFPDRSAHGEGDAAEPLYSVRFDARELSGEAAEARETILLDCWESYLSPGS
jgi:nitrile hydratase